MEENKNQEVLLEQYKLLVQTAENNSGRRQLMNHVYISIICTIMLINFSTEMNVDTDINKSVGVTLYLLGILICTLWIFNLYTYRKLNSAKYKVIINMEKLLAFPCFDAEWKIFNSKRKRKRLTNIEELIPLICILIFIFLILFKIF